MATSPPEIVYYEDAQVKVTNARAILGSKTYALANITSVGLYKDNPSNILPILMIVGGGLLLIPGIFMAAVGDIESGIPCAVISFLLIAIGIGVMVTSKPSYIFRIGSASGEADALKSRNLEYMQRIVGAVNEAIVRRG